MIWIAVALLALATLHDLRKREVPDVYAVLLLGLAVAAVALDRGRTDWAGAGLGFLLGFGLGALLFWLGAMGGADAKLFAALGAFLGPGGFLVFAFYTAVLGGILSAIAGRKKQKELAYVPAMLLGLVLYEWTGGRMPHEYF